VLCAKVYTTVVDQICVCDGCRCVDIVQCRFRHFRSWFCQKEECLVLNLK